MWSSSDYKYKSVMRSQETNSLLNEKGKKENKLKGQKLKFPEVASVGASYPYFCSYSTPNELTI